MTKFNREGFSAHGGYVVYGSREQFVARFKHNRSASGSFITFLIKNFSQEEYFGRLEAGESPLTILMDKGYLTPFIKKVLKQAGFPVTKAGFEAYVQRGQA